MTTELTTWVGQSIPAPTPQLTQSMSPQQLGAHRQEICSDVEMVLDGYWKDRPGPEMKARILADWADTLEDWSQGDVLGALRKWRNENPNKKPNPGHILQLLKTARGKAEAAKMPNQSQQKPEGPRERISPERAKEIAEAAGCKIGENGRIIIG